MSDKRIRVWHFVSMGLMLFVPAAFVLEFAHASSPVIFLVSCLAIVPLSGMMGRATDNLSKHAGATLGGLLNATLGNAAELIIGFFAIRKGLEDVVKASLTGSIIGNLLLVLGLSIFVGGIGREKQKFSKLAAESGAAMLLLAVAGLMVPAVLHKVSRPGISAGSLEKMSLAICVVLVLSYVAGLLFSLKTHRKAYETDEDHTEGPPAWSLKKSLAILIVSAGLVGVLAEFLVGSMESACHWLGLSETFMGVVAVAIVGNAAEHSTAVLMALKDRMNITLHIAMESSKQIALLVAPVLVFASLAMGKPMNLEFTTFEVFAVGTSVAIVTLISLDGESNWLEGVQLLAVYLVLAIAFFFL